ncbi:MAG: hypothetical protein ACREN7_01425 [Candidatus Dormibacteria bacterium]
MGGAGLYLVLRAIGAGHLSILAVLPAYAFGVTVALMVPIMTDVGSLEVSTVATLATAGVATSAASAAVVVDRALMVAAPALFLACAALLFRDRVRRILSPRTPKPPNGEGGRSRPRLRAGSGRR